MSNLLNDDLDVDDDGVNRAPEGSSRLDTSQSWSRRVGTYLKPHGIWKMPVLLGPGWDVRDARSIRRALTLSHPGSL
jgi:hypothetical protein